ncbi:MULTISPECIES: hypothetical protein [unclassified Acinetobacter]|jgi:hypothetical protein|uniref:hypothetical protein n=1 Tax=unclassified Acinetobacter TaxID=196816 RepID=UPI00148A70F3|nr:MULTISPECIES: hypothetical protein [unclassified Acinetobacter]
MMLVKKFFDLFGQTFQQDCQHTQAVAKMNQAIVRMQQKQNIEILRTDYLE